MRIATVMTTVGVLLFSAITLADNVNYDFDPNANFSSFRTYTWVRGNEVGDQLNHSRIVRAIETQLGIKGLTKVDANDRPDVLVAYHASFDENLQISGFSTGFGGYRFGGNRSGTARVEEITIGTLAVDIVDARTKTIVWRAMASKELDPKASPEKRDKNINKATEKLFRNYPTGR
jgi:hypothetical protein